MNGRRVAALRDHEKGTASEDSESHTPLPSGPPNPSSTYFILYFYDRSDRNLLTSLRTTARLSQTEERSPTTFSSYPAAHSEALFTRRCQTTPPPPGATSEAQLLCDWILDCPVVNDDCAVPRAFFLAGAAPEADCLAWMARVASGPGRDAMDAALSSDRLELDASTRGALLDDCSFAIFAIDEGPRAGYTGAIDPGEACSLDGECVPGSYCNFGAGQCPGLCAARRSDGDACDQDRQCDSGFCGGSDVCASLDFETNAGVGSPCFQTSVSPTAVTLTNCASGLFCSVADDLCAPLPDIGDECSDAWDAPCVRGLCLDTTDAVARCIDLIPVNEGEACDDIEVDVSGTTARVCDE